MRNLSSSQMNFMKVLKVQITDICNLRNYKKMKIITTQLMKQNSPRIYEVWYVVPTNPLFLCHSPRTSYNAKFIV